MAGSPWGNNQYPPYPVQYAPAAAAPSFDPRRVPYAPPPPATRFYNGAVMPRQPSVTDMRALRGMAMMAMPQPSIPPVLQPGAEPRSPPYAAFRSNSGDLSGDLFFDGPPRMPIPQMYNTPLPQASPQIRYTASAPLPPLPKKPSFDVPPLPPKPTKTSPPGALPLYSQALNGLSTFSEPSTSSPQTPRLDNVTESVDPALPPAEEDDVALQAALEQSKGYAEAARRREEEELAKAMAESLTVSPRRESAQVSPIASGSGSSYYEKGPSSSASTSFGSGFPFPAPTSTISFVQTPEPASLSAPVVSPPVLTSSPTSMSQQILDDEALARQLAEEEERLARQKQDEERAKALADAQAAEQARKVAAELALPPHPPEYQAADPPSFPPSPLTAPEDLALPSPESGGSETPFPLRSTVSSPDIHRHSGSTHSGAPLCEDNVRAGRSQSFGAYSASSPGIKLPLPHSPLNRPRSSGASPNLPSVPETANSVNSHSGENASSTEHTNSLPASPGDNDVAPRSTSQYVDAELLRGVSIGFNPPSISSVLTPMDGPIPNVIALPYGRAPPLHIKAPNWRDMLKLMARLSNTRLEPTVEAMAVVKTAMHLRAVVNFVKVHASSSDWHVVLYMTIDYPIPDGHRYKSRNQNDPALLPYSYTLSPTPAFLRESADSPLSKWYCIPATPQNAYPTLPVSFPDLATYLMNALEDSRRAMHDRSSGWSRLAKAIDTIYPSRAGAGDEDTEERARFTDRVRGFFGRGSRQNRPANDDRSDLVTPFYADDFGR